MTFKPVKINEEEMSSAAKKKRSQNLEILEENEKMFDKIMEKLECGKSNLECSDQKKS
jgi:ribosome assembly protein YihI (activator of Der GTPase)